MKLPDIAEKAETFTVGADFNKGLAAAQCGDFATALREWQPLAEQGHARAQYNLGWIYRNGKGVSQNYKTAMKWYSLAGGQGDVYAQNNLGVMYYNGEGVSKNYKTAMKWHTLAAEQGDASAQYNLGKLYYYLQDYVYAHMWLNLADHNGYDGADSKRKRITIKMTASQIEKAQALAVECVRKEYKGCC